MKVLRWAAVLLFFCGSAAFATQSFSQPRLGIFLSKASYHQDWETSQLAGHGWVGVANLAGLPYDTLFVEEMPSERELARYSALVFAQASLADDATYAQLVARLRGYLAAGHSVVVDGPLAVKDEKGNARDHQGLDDLLGVNYKGPQGESGYRIRVRSNDHFVTQTFAPAQFLTPALASALEILEPRSGSVLLVSTDGEKSFPYLSCSQPGKGRVVLVSDFGTSAGAGTFFRNDPPQVAYANQLWNALIRAVQWAAYGDIDVPFPAPQVTNANLTAIVRFDGDNSGELQYQLKTLHFLTGVAEDTGVVPLYTWVSSFVKRAGWDKLAPLGKHLEELGGEIGTHSKFHNIDREMTPERWKEELDGSIQEIEENMRAQGYPIRKIQSMINPGDTIPMGDYDEVARRFSFYMTHGLEQSVPVGFGNMTWFTGTNKDFVVLENSPHPDYQWFYDPTWSYTTAQITANEEAIFDHMFHNIGRGVIFNEMWHDYSISSMPVHEGKEKRIINANNFPFYEAMKTKFGTLPVYCPEPQELAQKVRAMAQWNYSWKATDDLVEMQLDLSSLRRADTAESVGGMGIRIENTRKYIQSVTIDGRPHPAFDNQLLILPNLSQGKHTIVVRLGATSAGAARLTYISKQMTEATPTTGGLAFQVKTKTKARFAVAAPWSAIALQADAQEFDENDGQIKGFVRSDRRIEIAKIELPGFRITRANARVIAIKEGARLLSLRLAPGTGSQLELRAERPLAKVTLGGQNILFRATERGYALELPSFAQETELILRF
ncbi:MAG: hypothetical protein JST79_15880 [Acidobacteria bacterium]|nr:hypothetical protein [Acidobacteriota bacterium]